MNRSRLRLLPLLLASWCLAAAETAALDPPHDTSRSIDCTNCHITHHAPGGAITSMGGNPNLCISCHTAGGMAATKAFADADQAIPGTSGSSHRWDSGPAGWVSPGAANTSPGTVQSGGVFAGRYRKSYTITITSAGDAGSALFSWSTSNRVAQTYLDAFTTVTYSGSNGTQNWSATPWQEVVETDGPTAGVIQVVSSTVCAADDCLRIGGGTIDTRALQRTAILTPATAATLTFSYQRQLATCPSTSTASVALQVSTNGTTWTTLATYALNACDLSQVVQAFDLTAYIAAATQIRIVGTGTTAATDFIYVDNVQLQYLAPGSSATNVGTGNNVALDEGITVSFANGAASPSFNLNDQWTVFASTDVNQPTTPALAASTAGGVITCSTCHNQHSQVGAPFDPAAPPYPTPGPGGAGRHFQRVDNDTDQMCVDCHSARNVAASSLGSHPVAVLIPATGLYKNP